MAVNIGNFDYIIVGAGSAGCVLANRLSANSQNQVLLIEAGNQDWNPWIHIPVGYFKTLHNPSTDWCYKTEPVQGLNGRSLDWPRGKVLGGSSSINGLLYIRGQDADYNHWRQLGNSGWSADDLLPYFRRSEDQELGESEYHGVHGPLSVTNHRGERKICDAIISAAETIGIPRNSDFNAEDQEGAGYFQLTARNGRRCSSAVAYLNPIKRRKNLKIVTQAQAEKLIFGQNDECLVSGIQFSYKKRESAAYLKKGGEVILSAGTVASPQLLQLSGIGSGEVLKSFDINVLKDLPGVGQNLQDHLQIRLVFEVNIPTLNDDINSFFRRTIMGMQYILFRSGPMTSGASQVCIFTKTTETINSPDLQFHFQPLSADKPGIKMHPFSGITLSVCQLRPESRGEIVIKSPDIRVYPSIQPNYLSAITDQEIVIAAIKKARMIARSVPLSNYIIDEKIPGTHVCSDIELLEAARNFSHTIYHPVGTCKMGTDKFAVVDERLRVHGINNLRVADASIMPTIVSGNTNAPSIMIGEKASDMILEDRPR